MAKRKSGSLMSYAPDADESAQRYDAVAGPSGDDVEVTPGSVDPTQATAQDSFLRNALAKDAARGNGGPPRRIGGPKPRINPNALDERPYYGVFLQGPSAAGHELVCICDTIGRARKQCATLQAFPAYAGKALIIQRIKAVECFRP